VRGIPAFIAAAAAAAANEAAALETECQPTPLSKKKRKRHTYLIGQDSAAATMAWEAKTSEA